MSWRLTDKREWKWYAILCPECGLRRGWRLQRDAEQGLLDMGAAGLNVQGVWAEEYVDGEAPGEPTCPHGQSDAPPKQRKAPKPKREG